MNRGSATGSIRSAGRTDAFNEAPIHESGKWRARWGAADSANPFNEAPIHESGK